MTQHHRNFSSGHKLNCNKLLWKISESMSAEGRSDWNKLRDTRFMSVLLSWLRWLFTLWVYRRDYVAWNAKVRRNDWKGCVWQVAHLDLWSCLSVSLDGLWKTIQKSVRKPYVSENLNPQSPEHEAEWHPLKCELVCELRWMKRTECKARMGGTL